jgi:hypothetical protein
VKQRDWYLDHRRQWILEMLDIYGFINRGHVVRKFGISEQQVAIDFRQLLKDEPDAMIYNVTTKRYEKMTRREEDDGEAAQGTEDINIRLRRRASSGGDSHQ